MTLSNSKLILTLCIGILCMLFSDMELQAQPSVKSISSDLVFFIDDDISENEANIENELQVPVGESLQLDPKKSIMTFAESEYIYTCDIDRTTAYSAILSKEGLVHIS